MVLLASTTFSAAWAQVGDMFQEQAREKIELQKMHDEVKDIKSTINDAVQQLDQVQSQANSANNVHEVHLIAKEANLDINSKTSVACFTYNGRMPGPEIRVREGEIVRIVLHNQLRVPTSLIFHGIILPQSVSGLPRKDSGLVQPGASFIYQFAAPQRGTYWYHPQVVNGDQKARGMFGALIVEPRETASAVEKDWTVFLSDLSVPETGIPTTHHPTDFARAPQHSIALHTAEPFPSLAAAKVLTFYLMNGKSAPAIPPIELRKGERVRLRVINAGSQTVPLYLSGHRFEVVSVNGGDQLEPHLFRDTLAVQPSDRIDLEFSADNPGVWSLASEIPLQATNQGHFPGGIACVVRYSGEGGSSSTTGSAPLPSAP